MTSFEEELDDRDPYLVALGERIRRVRKSNDNMSQMALAYALGKAGPSTVSEWERGKTQIGVGDLIRLAETCGVSLCELLGVEHATSPLEDDLLRYFQGLPPNQREAMFEAMRALWWKIHRPEGLRLVAETRTDYNPSTKTP